MQWILLTAIIMLSPVSARMGDSYADAVKRYGDPVKTEQEQTVFRKLGFEISVTFHDGRVDSILYQRVSSPITRAEAERLVQINGGADWEPAEDAGWFRRSKDKKTVAHWNFDSTTLLIVTEAHRERQREKQRRKLDGL